MKRIALILLSLVMVLSCVVAVPFSVAAENATATGADESLVGYKPENVKTADVSEAITMTAYCAADAYAYNHKTAMTVTIGSGAELKMFADRVNEGDGFTNMTVVFIDDIDMTGITMDSIGAQARKGTVAQPVAANYAHTGLYNTIVYGQGHTISNLTMTGGAKSFGLIGFLWGQLYDLRMDDTCTITATVAAAADGGVGSFVGRLGNATLVGKIENCYSAATLVYTGSTTGRAPVGGIVGSTSANVEYVVNCTFAGKVSSSDYDYLGGIVGSAQRNALYITNCVNKGEVTYTGTADYGDVGGILGNFTPYANAANQTIYIDNCINYGTLTTTNAAKTWIGGIVGMVRGLSATNLEKYPDTTWTLNITNCTSAGAMVPNYTGKDAATIATYSDMVESFYNWTTDAATIVNGAHGPASAQNGQLVVNEENNKVHYGYAAGRVIKKDNFDDCFEITATTTLDQVNAATQNGFVIYTPEAFLNFAANMSNTATVFTKDKTIYLGADMDMSGITWSPISKSAAVCLSTFDGQGHTISNLVVVSSGNFNVALFGRYYGIIKNIVVDGTCMFKSTSGYAAGINANAGKVGTGNAPAIINCFNQATVMSYGNTAAGIVRADQCDVYNCTNAGLITDPNSNGLTNLAGIFGGFSNAGRGGWGKIVNNANYGTVHNGRANNNIAGIAGIASRVGYAAGASVVLGNANYGLVDNMNAGGAVSAIVTFQVVAADQASATGNWLQPSYMVCANNTNYGTLVNYVANNNWAQTEFATFSFSTNPGSVVPTQDLSCTLGAVCGNVSTTDLHGYAESRVMSKAADYSKVPDITSVFTFNGSAVSGTAKPLMKVTNAEGLDMLSIIAHFAPTTLNNSQIVIANDIDMTGWSFPEDITDTAAVWTAPNVFVPIGWVAPRATENGNPNVNSYDTKQIFRGFVDGLGHEVKNWVVNYDKFYTVDGDTTTYHGGNNIGLFANTWYSVIQNLILDESCQLNNQAGATNAVRAFVTYGNYTAVVNCKNEADLTGSYAGGIMGFANTCAVVNCTNNGDITSTHISAAGIAANTNSIAFFANNRNNGAITGVNYTAGILGTWHAAGATPRVLNNLNVGTVYTRARTLDDETQEYIYELYAGAIAARVQTAGNLYEANNIDLGGVAYGTEAPIQGMKYEHGIGVTTALSVPARATTPAEIVAMLTTAYQNGTGNEVALRFVTTVDTLAYGTVGFRIKCGDQYAEVPMSTVYSSIIGADETYTPDEVGYENSEYFAVFTLTDIPADTEFTVEAYVITANGTVIYGAARNIVA
ncbi:MAG: hypothetical protein IKC31_03310 [Clostridia bacterium]|nr:hypothetical protein [Clostridia bacterium]